MTNVATQTTILAQSNTDYVPSGVIRTLTEEETAAVSGGLTPQEIALFTTGQAYKSNTNWFQSFQPSHNTYSPSNYYTRPSSFFVPVVPWVPQYNPVWFGI